MGESKRKKERRREMPKPTSKLPPLPHPADRTMAAEQQAFCEIIVNKMLQDESSLSFSKPVSELWDISQLEGYFEKIKEPMDLDTVKKGLESKTHFINKETKLFDVNAFRQQIRLVFWNAMEFNGKGTDLYRLGNKFLQFVDAKLTELPGLAKPHDDQSAMTNDTGGKSEKDDRPVWGKDVVSKDEQVIDGKTMKTLQAKVPDRADEEMNDDEVEENNNDESTEEETEKLNRRIASMEKLKSRAKANLAELELMRNVPLTHEENARLRDEVEALPWETAKKVVKVLRKQVDEALADINEEDPEFVTLELSAVEPHLLRDIEALIRPDPRVEEEKKRIANLDEEIGAVRRCIKRVSSGDTSPKKKPRRRR